jgi:hypothetical protein
VSGLPTIGERYVAPREFKPQRNRNPHGPPEPSSRVRRMVLGEVAILIAIGLAATLGTTRFVKSFLYGIKGKDPV